MESSKKSQRKQYTIDNAEEELRQIANAIDEYALTAEEKIPERLTNIFQGRLNLIGDTIEKAKGVEGLVLESGASLSNLSQRFESVQGNLNDVKRYGIENKYLDHETNIYSPTLIITDVGEIESLVNKNEGMPLDENKDSQKLLYQALHAIDHGNPSVDFPVELKKDIKKRMHALKKTLADLQSITPSGF